ncbi:hypothetical protein Tco_0929489, partial [Tanacetum coccineum]
SAREFSVAGTAGVVTIVGV